MEGETEIKVNSFSKNDNFIKYTYLHRRIESTAKTITKSEQ